MAEWSSKNLPYTLTELLTYIAYSQLGVRAAKGEEKSAWASRAVYSIVGLMSSCALWNHSDREPTDEQTVGRASKSAVVEDASVGVSKVYWKKYAKKLFYAYYSKYPEIEKFYPDDLEKLIRSEYIEEKYPLQEHADSPDIQSVLDKASWDDLVNEMLDLYIQTGSYYAKNYQIGPSALRYVSFGHDPKNANKPYTYLARGVAPNVQVFMSGLGAWLQSKEPIPDACPIEDVFNLQQAPLDVYYNELQERFNTGSFLQDSLPNNCKFLRITPLNEKRWGEYWLDRMPEWDGGFSLLRYGNPGQEVYNLYQRYGERYLLMNLFSFETNPEFLRPYRGSRAYVKIASAILANRKTLPPIRVAINSEQAKIRLGYWLPPEEQSFFKLYTWPNSGFTTIGENFNRNMHIKLYPQYKAHLERLGYTIVES